MAEVQDIFGKVASGKVGTVSLYPLRGKTIMRSLRTDKGGPRTENQLRNQRRFKEIRKFCTPFKFVVIPRIWNDLATTSSGYHLFMKANSPAFDPDGVLAYPEKIRLSMGKLALPEGMQAKRTSEGGTTIEVKWEKDLEFVGISNKDQLMVISTAGGKYSNIKDTGLTRGNLGGSFELPAMASSASHIYLFFESIDQKYYSESACLDI
ncbi:MAG TPA: hypothetical protein DCL77_02390 [Prolixibacteraceae bacterium]|nr:hypothetical protein [Prolixibacteraceae bacterium]